jgi:mRNA interferase MazF
MNEQLAFPQGFPHRGEIYLVDFNRRKGKEIRKIRPAVVISNNIQNEYDIYLTVAPLTSDEPETIRPFEVLVLKTLLNGLNADSKILLNQIHANQEQILAEKNKFIERLEQELANKQAKQIAAENNLAHEKRNNQALLKETNANLTQKLHTYEQNYSNLANAYQNAIKDKAKAELSAEREKQRADHYEQQLKAIAKTLHQ